MINFISQSRDMRLYAGERALENLPREMSRLKASKAMVICGNSVATRTSLPDRIREILGESWAGMFGYMGKDAPLEDVLGAVEYAREIKADVLIAVGAGSVLKATRVVAMMLGENKSVQDIATRFFEDRPPVSPKLLAPKPPIINVLTAATSAQNRAGAAIHNPTGGPRLEFFDPKTRPCAVFWDHEALMTAPPSLAISTGVSVFWRSLMNIAAIDTANPLVQASRLHAFELARTSLPRAGDPEDVTARMSLCAAALLQNRDEDDGGRPFDVHWIASSVYALGAALFNRVRHLDQGITHAILTPAAIQNFHDLSSTAVETIGARLGLEPCEAGDPDRVCQQVRDYFAQFGFPLTLGEHGVELSDLLPALHNSLHNFNANRSGGLHLHRDRLERILEQSL
ncbi:iron-containing alcohol dehydrogenase [Orrella marina]|uniref:Alcohol dehydrogenase iron-type/glycerol dehydrogenase GldA domain-containing protein n=1 Tax=Orrella marina TaxID=2163011 RepID=A0A2R4XG42_9BURK|nr:iron-containing alcohol dehydrogenase [Orrella marina]AWB32709.1 hypothetical protein DBV39_02125 [Orrella marina]